MEGEGDVTDMMGEANLQSLFIRSSMDNRSAESNFSAFENADMLPY